VHGEFRQKAIITEKGGKRVTAAKQKAVFQTTTESQHQREDDGSGFIDPGRVGGSGHLLDLLRSVRRTGHAQLRALLLQGSLLFSHILYYYYYYYYYYYFN
jgi:hypothetical protein